jgi:cysteinyl-tRNA synthetase
MTVRLFNTLSNTVEDLEPSDGETLRIYVCGPTVYDYGHIGNFRTFLQLDVLRRFWKQKGRKIEQVMNITDVDDKIIRNAAAAHLEIKEYTQKYERAFFQDLDALSCEHPEIVARATENIPQMVALIERLAAKDLAYQAPDGSWYFRIAGFPEYGKLS